jgi:hypothetical protein
MTLTLGHISIMPALIVIALKAGLTHISVKLIHNFALNLGQLLKLYSNDIKYGGSDDLFALKLNIFYNCY